MSRRWSRWSTWPTSVRAQLGTTLVALVLLVAPVAPMDGRAAPAPGGEAASRPRPPSRFGPFDAGAPRAVTRHGQPARARRAHPAVGTAGKVPGEGPPPPPLPQDGDIPELALAAPNALAPSLSSSPLWLAALTYQHLLTRLDGPRCQHLPTCSRFASQAVARHGAMGILMGLDRLIRPTESSALRRLPEVEGWGALRGFDPLENYEFWRHERFSGFPPAVDEEPLVLGPPAASSLASDAALAAPAATPAGPSTRTPAASSPGANP